MHEFLVTPPKDLIGSTDYLGVGENAFKDVEALRSDSRSSKELWEFISKESGDHYKDKEKLLVGILWTKIVLDETTLKSALIACYSAIVKLFHKSR